MKKCRRYVKLEDVFNLKAFDQTPLPTFGQKRKRRPSWLKDQLSEAQNHRCCLCGTHLDNCISKHSRRKNKNSKSYPTFEHIKPLFRGGLDVLDNIVITCQQCNSSRDPYKSIL